MTLSDSEIQSLKTHLGYGSIGADAEPYISFSALFEQVIAPNLTTAAETTSASSITAGLAIVTPASMLEIVPRASLVIGVGDDAEIVTVAAVTMSTFSARFRQAHAASTPIAVMSGTARLRMLLHRADQAWAALMDASVGATAGLQSVDKGDVVWFAGFQVLKDRVKHYRSIVDQIGSLVRVTPRWPDAGGACTSSY